MPKKGRRRRKKGQKRGRWEEDEFDDMLWCKAVMGDEKARRLVKYPGRFSGKP